MLEADTENAYFSPFGGGTDTKTKPTDEHKHDQLAIRPHFTYHLPRLLLVSHE
jgi:hypothetical protein